MAQQIKSGTAIAALWLVAVVVYGVAQDTKETPSFQMQLNVERLLVPAIVRDAHGNTIPDLKQENFKVFDNGKLRPISGLTVEQRGALLPGQPPTVAEAAQQPAPPGRITVFLFDDMHLTSEDLVRARSAGIEAIDGAITGMDLAAVLSISGAVNTGLTRDRDKLQQGLAQLSPHSLYHADTADCPHIDYYEADLIENKHDPVAVQDAVQKYINCHPAIANPAEVPGADGNSPNAEGLVAGAAMRALSLGRQDVLSTLAVISDLTRRMTQVPGQRSLILVSPGFLNVEREALDAESRIIDMAARSNLTVSSLDARGLYTTELTASQRSPNLSGRSMQENADLQRSAMKLSENVMAELADGTGGRFFHNSNDLESGLKQLSEQPQTLYILELSIADVKRNGSLHRLAVKVDREGLTVNARQTYFVPKPDKNSK